MQEGGATAITCGRDDQLLGYSVLAGLGHAGQQFKTAVEVLRVVERGLRRGIGELLVFGQVRDAGQHDLVAEGDLHFVLPVPIDDDSSLRVLDISRLCDLTPGGTLVAALGVERETKGLGGTNNLGVVDGHHFHRVRIVVARNISIGITECLGCQLFNDGLAADRIAGRPIDFGDIRFCLLKDAPNTFVGTTKLDVRLVRNRHTVHEST